MTPPPPKQPSDNASSSSSLPLWMAHHRRHQQERRSLTGTDDTSSRNRNLHSLFQQLHAVDGGGVLASQFAPRRSVMEILDDAIQLQANYYDLQQQQLPLRRPRSEGSSRGTTTPTSTTRRPTGGSPRDSHPNQDPAADDLPSKKQ